MNKKIKKISQELFNNHENVENGTNIYEIDGNLAPGFYKIGTDYVQIFETPQENGPIGYYFCCRKDNNIKISRIATNNDGYICCINNEYGVFRVFWCDSEMSVLRPGNVVEWMWATST